MQIITKKHINRNCNNIDNNNKLLLIDNILTYFSPLFNEEIERNRKQLNETSDDYSKLTNQVNSLEKDLSKIRDEIKKQELIKLIMNSIAKLINHDVLYGSSKNNAIKTVREINNLTIDRLHKCNDYFSRLIKKHINKVQ